MISTETKSIVYRFTDSKTIAFDKIVDYQWMISFSKDGIKYKQICMLPFGIIPSEDIARVVLAVLHLGVE